MTQFKEGDEVLVKAKFLCGREGWYYNNSKQKMYYDEAVLTFDYEIEGYFAPCVKDLIPASALDVNKQLLAENNRLREEIYDLTLTFLLSKEKQDAEIERLRGDVEFASECRNGAYADVEIRDAKIERLRGVLLTVLEACKDVNSPDRKVREEITRTVRKALKEKK